MPRTFACRLAAFGLALAALAAPARAEDPSTDEAAKARLEFLQRLFERFELSPADDPERRFDKTADPVLRYSNPVRAINLSDGTLFLWLDAGRPVAAVTLSVRGENKVSREVSSLSGAPLVCTRDGEPVWSPQAGGLLDQTLPDGPQPAPSASLRLVQMRKLAGRFTADFRVPTDEEFSELRVLSQPLYRYASEERGVVDGALFGFAEANDPELLLRLELVKSSGDAEPQWRYSLARMSSVIIRVRLDGQEVWTTNAYWRNPRTPEDPYMEVNEGMYTPPGETPETPAVNPQ